MIARYGFSCRFRSDPILVGSAVLFASMGCLFVAAATNAASAGAIVRGTIRIEQATFKADGPKHDRDVVVMLEPVGSSPPAKPANVTTMDQRGLVFIPHVLAVHKGSAVRFLNNDNDQHNVYFLADATGKTLDIGTHGPGVSVEHRFDTAGVTIVLCKLHLEMAAYIVVSTSPWFTTTQIDPATGRASFTVHDVPPGEYRLNVWHKHLRATTDQARVTVPQSGTLEVPIVLTTARRLKKSR